MIHLRLFYYCLFTGVVFVANSQYREQPPQEKTERLSKEENGNPFYFGGGGGLSGGSNYLNVSVSPLIGYKITQKLSTGLQFSFLYTKINDLSLNSIGGGHL